MVKQAEAWIKPRSLVFGVMTTSAQTFAGDGISRVAGVESCSLCPTKCSKF